MITGEDVIDEILRREGSGFTNDPLDRGGPTKWGITQATLSRYLGRPASVQEVQALTRDMATEVYRELYLYPVTRAVPELPARVLGLLVDSNVQHNPKMWQTWFQTAIGATPDGQIGPQTLLKWRDWRQNAGLADKLHNDILGQRIRYYFKIIHDDPTQSRFANGWANRVTEFLKI